MNPYLNMKPTFEAKRKIDLSRKEVDGLTLRDVKCPYCGFVISRVYPDVQGHIMAKCQKCKNVMTLNLAYFRRQKGIGRLRKKYFSK